MKQLRELEPRARVVAYCVGALVVAWVIVAAAIQPGPILAVLVAVLIGVIGGAVIQAASKRKL